MASCVVDRSSRGAACELVATEREAGTTIGAGIPTWVAQLVLPVAFALIALRLVWRAGPALAASRRSRALGLVAALPR